jgi:GNAT superfamily N-acetyltransferase
MSDVTLIPLDPTPDEVQFLEDRIYEFNSSATDITDGELLAFFVREGGRIVAGICGNTWGGTCELRQFWVEASLRHRGLGTKLFQAAEQEARRRGCTQIVLMTFSFQAPAFYERHGFEVVATIDNHPHGHRNLLMRKRLRPQDVFIRPARPDEQQILESLQRRASLNNPGDRDALLANPDAIELPLEQIAEGCVFVAD